MIIQGEDTTKYRSRQYDNTRRRYNKVPEPPIQQYEAEIQQSTGATNTTIRGGDTTKYRSRQYNNTRRRYNKVPEPPIQYHDGADVPRRSAELPILALAAL